MRAGEDSRSRVRVLEASTAELSYPPHAAQQSAFQSRISPVEEDPPVHTDFKVDIESFKSMGQLCGRWRAHRCRPEADLWASRSF